MRIRQHAVLLLMKVGDPEVEHHHAQEVKMNAGARKANPSDGLINRCATKQINYQRSPADVAVRHLHQWRIFL